MKQSQRFHVLRRSSSSLDRLCQVCPPTQFGLSRRRLTVMERSVLVGRPEDRTGSHRDGRHFTRSAEWPSENIGGERGIRTLKTRLSKLVMTRDFWGQGSISQ